MSVSITVIVPTRNPDSGRLERTLAGIEAQDLPRPLWELVVVDNDSDRPWDVPTGAPCVRVQEPRRGLTHARIRGIRAANGELIVFVDDDNVLVPGYLSSVAKRFTDLPRLGAASGPVEPEWEASPPAWINEFRSLLALRNLGPSVRICTGGAGVRWPDFAPVGAGLSVRREAALSYAAAVDRNPLRQALDRAGENLGSGGDNDLVFSILHSGCDVGYFPELGVTHLIPRTRLDPAYLGRLNEGIMRTWVLVLHLHGQCPWPAIPPWTVPIRSARAWLRTRAWRSPENWIRWRGRRGQFRGQALLRTIASDKHVHP